MASLSYTRKAACPLRATDEKPWVRWLLTGITVAFLTVFLLFPLFTVFREAFARGVDAYFSSFDDRFIRHSIRLTLITAAICVPLNLIFGLAAAWAVTKFDFKGKSLLVTIIDLPFSVSPVIAGFVFIIIFGANGYLGPWVDKWGFQVVFAFPGIVLATTFGTVPFIARELIPLMEAQGRDEEYAAMSLGASGWRTFFTVTLPNVKWGLFYGVILCNARAMGEFGGVEVVSGKISGRTNTMTLQIQQLYFDYATVPAFAVASLLALLALFTLVLKNIVEWWFHRRA
ncbi:MAG: sulfate ABC transporter permease subunit CysW [Luteolibacter sp.]